MTHPISQAANPAPIPNMNTLTQLADKEVSDSVTDFGSLPLDIRESLERQINERRKDVVDAAAGEIVKLLNAKDLFLTLMAQNNAKLQEQITNNEALMAKVARATEYGLVTQNFLPLASQLGYGSGGAKKSLLEIPKDWVKPEATEAAPAAAAAGTGAGTASA